MPLGCRNRVCPMMFSDLVTPSSCSFSHGLWGSLQSSWFFGSTLARSEGSLCPDFSMSLLRVFHFLNTWRRETFMAITVSCRIKQTRVQLLALPLALCDCRAVVYPYPKPFIPFEPQLPHLWNKGDDSTSWKTVARINWNHLGLHIGTQYVSLIFPFSDFHSLHCRGRGLGQMNSKFWPFLPLYSSGRLFSSVQ